jgi:hypothetical protein
MISEAESIASSQNIRWLGSCCFIPLRLHSVVEHPAFQTTLIVYSLAAAEVILATTVQ